MTLLPAMPAIPSLMSRVVASDRLRKLKEISNHIYHAVANYHFTLPSFYSVVPIAVAGTYLHYHLNPWGHRQLWSGGTWRMIFDGYIKENVI